jgi:hypothetical protein
MFFCQTRHRWPALGLILAGLTLGWCSFAASQQIHKNGFEGQTPSWEKGAADGAVREVVHEISDAYPHFGERSEHLQVVCRSGSYAYYYYPVTKAPLGDDLTIGVWIRANRPGVQILARLVLPKERDPRNLDQPLTVLLPGDFYQPVSRWKKLEVRRPTRLARSQQQLMRASLQRDVDFSNAYVDQVVLNVYSGPGMTELWIDDLEVGPVADRESPFSLTGRPGGPVTLRPPSVLATPAARAAVVELDHDQLVVNGRRFFPRGIRHSDTPLNVLRNTGFNTVWLDRSTPTGFIDEAANLGFWLVPGLSLGKGDPNLENAEALRSQMDRFTGKDAVLFWDLGSGLMDEQSARVAQLSRVIRTADPPRPVGADVWDGLRAYSRTVDLLGIHRWPLLTGMELMQYRDWLYQRRLLARPGVFLWTWVQTHLPDWYTTLVFGKTASAGFSEPIGPQPEQIRLLTYLALATGCKGLGFWSDRFLADSHQGRDRLLTLAILNQEIKMLEPLLGDADDPAWIDTSIPEVKAAVLRTQHGILVLPMWLGTGGQFVPGQSAAINLRIVVPQIPDGAQAWQVSAADVRALRFERVIGGTALVLPEFGVTSAIIFTSENGPEGIVVRLQNQVRSFAKVAAQWAIYLAQDEINKVGRVEAQLEELGHRLTDAKGHELPDSHKLMDNARERLKRALALWDKADYREAYAEADRALRPLRIVMRLQWDRAVADLSAPVASPYAVSFYTLPAHWKFMDEIHQGRFGPNLLPNGSFETTATAAAGDWLPQESKLDDVDLAARRVADQPKDGKQCLLLEIKPRVVLPPPEPPLERAFLAINSPAVRLQPGTRVKISGWIRIPRKIAGTVDGVLFYDSAGGEPLAIRLQEPMPWRQFTLYRWVPSSGQISVTLALTGIGQAYFDDIRIEPMMP